MEQWELSDRLKSILEYWPVLSFSKASIIDGRYTVRVGRAITPLRQWSFVRPTFARQTNGCGVIKRMMKYTTAGGPFSITEYKKMQMVLFIYVPEMSYCCTSYTISTLPCTYVVTLQRSSTHVPGCMYPLVEQ